MLEPPPGPQHPAGPPGHATHDGAGHFRLCIEGTILIILQRLAETLGGVDALFTQYPFLRGLAGDLESRGAAWNSRQAIVDWFVAVETWERGIATPLPLRDLRVAASLGHAGVTMLLAAGLPDEDPRFGDVYAHLQSAQHSSPAPAGLLNSWWRDLAFHDESTATVRRLQQLGLVRLTASAGSRHLWPVTVPPLLWDALAGTPEAFAADGFSHTPRSHDAPALVVEDSVREALAALPELIASGQVAAVVARGPSSNGRRHTLRALAHSLGCGLLELPLPARPDDDRWLLVGPLATALHAMPVVVCELSPAETATIPRLHGYHGVLGVTVERHGGVSGPAVDTAVTIELTVPDVTRRRILWSNALPSLSAAVLDEVSRRHRLTSGNIARLAPLAAAHSLLARHPEVAADDVRTASRSLNRQILDTLAARVPADGAWDDLAVAETTLGELRTLEARCRHRETLAHDRRARTQGAGVRALFSGPSGTGKTLAARVLAASLGLDLYRVDLSAVVNKYIGETEKNLNKLLSRAEELDIVLLLDEGDALLTQRTAVANANDRYANLETSFLLQRLESFEGILIATTNAGDRIDSAFQRRMDIVVDFRPPDAAERRRLWQLHLPDVHRIDEALLERVAARCPLTGGQIRNAALHARVLALDNGGVLTSSYVNAAIEREYRKLGAASPLRPFSSGGST